MSTPSTTPFVPPESRPRRPMSPHRRRQIQRRRIVALSVFAVGVLVISLAIDAGGGGSSHPTTGAALHPPPIVSLEATVHAGLRRPPAVRLVQRHHHGAAQEAAHADGALVGR